jgi:hypothetical protein
MGRMEIYSLTWGGKTKGASAQPSNTRTKGVMSMSMPEGKFGDKMAHKVEEVVTIPAQDDLEALWNLLAIEKSLAELGWASNEQGEAYYPEGIDLEHDKEMAEITEAIFKDLSGPCCQISVEELQRLEPEIEERGTI